MTARDDLLAVVLLACETGDRTPTEQRALLCVAERLELDLNGCGSDNLRARRGEPACRVVDRVVESWVGEGKPPAFDVGRLERQRVAFEHDVALPDIYGRKGAA
jgi:hypothetical protein